MKKIVLLFVILFTAVNTALFAQAGLIDNSFGNNGKVASEISAGNGEIWSMSMMDDWTIVVGGYGFNGVDSDFALMKYLPNGMVDSSFGTNGRVTTAMGPGSELIHQIVVQPDGKIIAAGFAWNGTDNDFALARYNANGTLDNSFGTNGKVVTAVGMGDDIGTSVVLQNDWTIVVGGSSFNGTDDDFVLVKYKTDGSIDSSFGTNGKVVTAMGPENDELAALTLQPDSSIIASGTVFNGSINNFALARYTKNGILDNTFGTGGKVIGSSSVNDDEGISVVLQPDGKIIVGGYAGTGTRDDFGLVRYLANGTPDNGFGTNGRVTTAIGDSSASIYAVTLQPDGKIIAVGSSMVGNAFQYSMARYSTTGALDNNFGTNGMVTTALTNGDNEAYAVVLQPDGKIVTAGYANNGIREEFSLARYISGLNLGVIDFKSAKPSVLIYPNPITENAVLQYTLTKEEEVSIRLVDMQGKTVETYIAGQKLGAGEHKQPMLMPAGLAAGSYLIVISSPEGQMSVKIVK